EEPEMSREESRNLWADLLRSYEATPGAALPPPGELFVKPEEVDGILTGRARWSLRHLRLEGEGEGVLPIAAAGRPSYRGRITTFLEECRRRTREGETTCILMSSVGTTKRMRELLDEAGIGAADLSEAAALEDGETGSAQASGVFLGTAPVSEGFSL